MEPAFITAARRILANKQAEKVDGILLDGLTARTMIVVYEALSPANQARVAPLGLARFAQFSLGQV